MLFVGGSGATGMALEARTSGFMDDKLNKQYPTINLKLREILYWKLFKQNLAVTGAIKQNTVTIILFYRLSFPIKIKVLCTNKVHVVGS